MTILQSYRFLYIYRKIKPISKWKKRLMNSIVQSYTVRVQPIRFNDSFRDWICTRIFLLIFKLKYIHLLWNFNSFCFAMTGKKLGLMIINMIHLSSYFRSKIFTITKLHKTYFNDQILSYLNSVRLGQAWMRDRIWLASVSVRFETCRQTFLKPDTDFRNINRQTSSSSRPLNNNNNNKN